MDVRPHQVGPQLLPVTVISAHTIGYYVIRSLGMMGVPVSAFYYDEKDFAQYSRFVKHKVKVPHPEKSEEDFIDFLLSKENRLSGGVLIPADDPTLISISKNKDILAEHYIIACPDWEVTERVVDKKYTYDLAQKVGVPIPRTIFLSREEDLYEIAFYVEYPCIVKPCRSHLYQEEFGKKMTIVNTKEELKNECEQAHRAGLEVLIQEYIPGKDDVCVNYNSYYANDDPVVEFTAQKCRLGPPGIGIPRVVMSARIPEILEPGRRILRALGFNGYSCTEFKKDIRDGVYKLMEVNGRHNRSGLLAVRCGINFPFIQYNDLTGGSVPSNCSFQENIYWIDEISDLVYWIKSSRKEKKPFLEYIKPYFSEHVFALLYLDDRKPIEKRLRNLADLIINPKR